MRLCLRVVACLAVVGVAPLAGCIAPAGEPEQRTGEAIIVRGPPAPTTPLTVETGPVDPNAPDTALTCGTAPLPLPKALSDDGCTTGIELSSDDLDYRVFACPLGIVPPPLKGDGFSPDLASPRLSPTSGGGVAQSVFVATAIDSHCVGNPDSGWELVLYLTAPVAMQPKPNPGCSGSACDDPAQFPVDLPGPLPAHLVQ